MVGNLDERKRTVTGSNAGFLGTIGTAGHAELATLVLGDACAWSTHGAGSDRRRRSGLARPVLHFGDLPTTAIPSTFAIRTASNFRTGGGLFGEENAEMIQQGTRAAHDVVVVRAGDHRFGFATGAVVEVQRIVACEPLPGAPAAVEGVIDVRGRMVGVLDLLERLGLASRPPELDDYVVIVDSGRHVVAVRVHEVLTLAPVAPGDFERTDRIVPAGPRVAGLARTGDGLVVIVDVDAFLGWDESAALDEALASRSPELEPDA